MPMGVLQITQEEAPTIQDVDERAINRVGGLQPALTPPRLWPVGSSYLYMVGASSCNQHSRHPGCGQGGGAVKRTNRRRNFSRSRRVRCCSRNMKNQATTRNHWSGANASANPRIQIAMRVLPNAQPGAISGDVQFRRNASPSNTRISANPSAK